MSKTLRSLIVLFVCVLHCMNVHAQTRIVTGKVLSEEDGKPLVGMNVILKGTTVGTITDGDGKYSISVPGAGGFLVFSFIGLQTHEEEIGSRSTLDVTMKADAKQLSEVVVVGYGSQEKRSLTGSQVSLKGNQIVNIPVVSVDQMLQGKVAGLQSVSFSGQPGANQQIRIRGIGSISANADPLYVVDGIPINSGDLTRNQFAGSSNALAGINPNDIEDVTVLKDAASASIYGSRAANGVILITTKKGTSGKTKFQLDAESGFSEIAIPGKAKPLNKQQYEELTTEGVANAGGLTSGLNIDTILDGYGANNGTETNWLEEVTRRGRTQQYNLSASGGNNKTTFFMSGGYFKQEATVIHSDFRRISGKISLTHNATDKLRFSTSLNISGNNQNTPTNGGTFASPVLSAYFLRPEQNAYTIGDGTVNSSLATFPSVFNPLWIAQKDRYKLSNLRGVGNVGVDYTPIGNLTLSTKFGIDYNGLEENQYSNGVLGDGRTSGGRAYAYYTRYFNWTWTNMANYRINFTPEKDFYVDVKVGYESQKSNGYFVSAYSTGFPTPLPATSTLILPVIAATPVTATASGADYTFASTFSNVSFNYKNRYSVSGSFRRDGSSRFGSNNRFGNFYSVGAAWNLTEENFMSSVGVLTELKIRGSYGVNGNAGIGNYAWRPTYGYTYNYNQKPGSQLNNIGNNNLSWELNKPFDIGIDAGIFNNAVTFTVDYYVRKTSKLLLNVPPSSTSGAPTDNFFIIDNIGAMENKGVEFTVNATPINKAIRWTLGFNIATNKNKITALNNGQDILSAPFIRRVGENFQAYYVREWAGVDPANGDPRWFVDGTHKETTNIYNDAQRVIHGSASPKVFGGFNTNLSYKGISLDAQVNYNFGNLIYDPWAQYYLGDGFNPGFNKITQQLERWQKPGDITNVPKYVYGNSNSSYSQSSRYLYKGDFIRLRSVTLAYNFPQSWIKKLNLTTANFYVRGTNLWTKKFDKNLYFDPEQGANSQANLNVFVSKTVTFGLNLGF